MNQFAHMISYGSSLMASHHLTHPRNRSLKNARTLRGPIESHKAHRVSGLAIETMRGPLLGRIRNMSWALGKRKGPKRRSEGGRGCSSLEVNTMSRWCCCPCLSWLGSNETWIQHILDRGPHQSENFMAPPRKTPAPLMVLVWR